eukprot:m.331874 g.331874  ORF g.331874 m.331874 type:complete len:336 (+) comp16514_c1_seq8:3259-4266(+)
MLCAAVLVGCIAASAQESCSNLPAQLGRQGAAAVVWKSDVLVVGGSHTPSCMSQNITHYDDVLSLQSGEWVTLAHLGVENQRTHHAAVVISDVLYVLGGYGGPDNAPIGNALASVISLDLTSPRTPAQQLKPLPGGPTTNLGAAAHLGSLYVAGGYRYPPGAPHAAPTNEVWSYDTATQAWTARAPMPTARAALGVAALLLPQHSFPRSGQSTGARMHPSANGETALFAVGGFSRSITTPSKYTPLNAVEVYHVESDTWYSSCWINMTHVRKPMGGVMANPLSRAATGVDIAAIMPAATLATTLHPRFGAIDDDHLGRTHAPSSAPLRRGQLSMA